MSDITRLKKHVIDEFSLENTQAKYLNNAEKGLWKSEKIVIKKYFRKNSSILDIGCGTGRTTIPLHTMGYKVTGIDLVPLMVKNANKIAQTKHLNVDYQIVYVTKLKFKESSFDGVLFSNSGWTQIPGKAERQKALNEVYRVLRLGGYFIFTAHYRKPKGHIIFWLIQWIKIYLLKPIGFKIKEIEFGDRFFTREIDGKKTKQKQYIHIPSIKVVKEQVKKSGLKLIFMAKINKLFSGDGLVGRGALSSREKSVDSPIFYICKK